MTSTRSDLPNTIFSIIFWLLLWTVLGKVVGEVLLLPTPTDVARAFIPLLTDESTYISISITLFKIISGLFLAFLCAFLSSFLSYVNKTFRALSASITRIIRATPVASIVILLLVWIESRNLSVVISFLMVFPIVHENILKGLDETDDDLLEAASSYHVSAIKKARYVYLPAVIPYFESALSLSVGLSFKSGIAAEVISLPSGSIGERLYEAKVYLETPELFAWTIMIIALSFLLEKCFFVLAGAISGRILK